MSGDEVMVLIVSLSILGWSWFVWYRRYFASLRSPVLKAAAYPLGIVPVAGAVILFAVLRLFSSHDVRDSVEYMLFYMAFGCAWIGALRLLIPVMGISDRDDALERRNAGAAAGYSGAILGLMLCFAGANIGDGPGWWVVLFCGLLSSAAFFLLWLLLEKAGALAESITVERDDAAGIRLGFFLISTGAILGRAVAGDWESGGAALVDFALAAWPALLLACIAVAVNYFLRPGARTGSRHRLVAGLLPGILYLEYAAGVLIYLGWW